MHAALGSGSTVLPLRRPGRGSAVRPAAAAAPPAATAGPSVSVVPGVEIIDAVPKPPPPPSQGMDFVLEQIKAKEAASEAAASATRVAAPKFEAPEIDFSAVKVPEMSKLDIPKIDLPKFDAPKVDAPKLDIDISGVSGSLSSGVSDLKEGASSAASQASAAAASAASAAASAITSVVGDNVKVASQAADAAASQVNSALNSAQSAIDATKAAAQATFGEATAAIGANVDAAVSALPPPARSALQAAATAADDAVAAAAAQPRVAAAVIGAAIAIPTIASLISNFAGYAGPYSPEAALEVLRTQDAILVDVRPDSQRQDNGLPELRRGARGKGLALPLEKLLPSISRRVRNPDALAIEILGAQIAALGRVNGSTRVIVLDTKGDVAKAVARAATAAGLRRVYIVSGGFAAWRRAGLAVVEGGRGEYDASPLTLVGDAAEEIAEEAVAALSTPQRAAPLVGGVALAALAAINYHWTFRFAGVLGLEATLAWRLLQYDSPQEALEDLGAAVSAVKDLASQATAAVQSSQGMVQEQQGGGSEASQMPAAAQQQE